MLLLLCNGYRLDLEATDGKSVLDEALTIRAFDILDLLLKWGADPTAVSTYNVIDTYKTDLIDRFWKAGVDYTGDPEFLFYLAHTVNKPLYGWLRRNRSDQRLQDALDVALLEAVSEDKELPVRLLLWAGANPHRSVPMIRELGRPGAWDEGAVFSSASAAITFGRPQLFDLLRIGTMPELDAQFPWAHDSLTLKKLVAIRPPAAWTEVILASIGRLRWPFRVNTWDVRNALSFIGSSGGRLVTVSPEQISFLRHVLLKVEDADTFLWLLRWLKSEKHCERAIYEGVTRARSLRKKIEALNAGARYLSASNKVSRAKQAVARGHRAESAGAAEGRGVPRALGYRET